MTPEINSEQTPQTLESLTQKYGQLAAQLGSVRYQRSIFELEETNLVTLMRDINNQAAEIKKTSEASPPKPVEAELVKE